MYTSAGTVHDLKELVASQAITRQEKLDVLLRLASEATARESGSRPRGGDGNQPTLTEILSALHELEPNQFV